MINRISLLLCLCFFGFSSCSDKGSIADFEPEFETYVLFPSEGLGDRGFVDAVYEGVEAAALRHSFKIHYLTPETLEKGIEWIASIPRIEARIGAGVLVVIAGNQYVEAVNALNGAFGTHKILLMGGIAEEHPNLISVDYRMYAPSYLSGYLSAGLLTNCRALAIAGFDAAFTREAIAGFEQGVKDAGGTVQAPIFLSTDFSGFEMPDSAHDRSLSLFAEFDLVFAFSDGSNIGIINAAREYDQQRYVIGVDADQNWMGTSVVTGSVMKHFKPDLSEFIGDYSRNEFEMASYLRTLEDGKSVFLSNPNLLDPASITNSLVNIALQKERNFK